MTRGSGGEEPDFARTARELAQVLDEFSGLFEEALSHYRPGKDALARHINVDKSYISSWLRGRRQLLDPKGRRLVNGEDVDRIIATVRLEEVDAALARRLRGCGRRIEELVAELAKARPTRWRSEAGRVLRADQERDAETEDTEPAAASPAATDAASPAPAAGTPAPAGPAPAAAEPAGPAPGSPAPPGAGPGGTVPLGLGQPGETPAAAVTAAPGSAEAAPHAVPPHAGGDGTPAVQGPRADAGAPATPPGSPGAPAGYGEPGPSPSQTHVLSPAETVGAPEARPARGRRRWKLVTALVVAAVLVAALQIARSATTPPRTVDTVTVGPLCRSWAPQSVPVEIRPCIAVADGRVELSAEVRAVDPADAPGEVTVWVWLMHLDPQLIESRRFHLTRDESTLNSCTFTVEGEGIVRCGPFRVTPPEAGRYAAAVDTRKEKDIRPPAWHHHTFSGTQSPPITWP